MTLVVLFRFSGFATSLEWSEGRWLHFMLYHWWLPMVRTSG